MKTWELNYGNNWILLKQDELKFPSYKFFLDIILLLIKAENIRFSNGTVGAHNINDHVI